MAETQVLIKNIPVLKTGIFCAVMFAVVFGILGLLVGLFMLFFGKIIEAIEIIIAVPLVMAVLAFIFGTIAAFGMRKGLGVAGGFPIFVENGNGTVLVKSLSVVKAAIFHAVTLAIIAIPFALLIGIIILASGQLSNGIVSANPGIAIAVVIGLPIVMLFLGFICGAIRTIGVNAGLSLSKGLPIKVETGAEGILFKGIDALKMGIVLGTEYFIWGVIIALAVFVIALMIPSTAVMEKTQYAAMDPTGSMFTLLAAMKGAMLLMVIGLPVMLMVYGIISGILMGLGINLGLKMISGLKVAADVKAAKAIFTRVGVLQAAVVFMLFYIFACLPTVVLNSLIMMVSNAAYGVLAFLGMIVEYLIFGAIMGIACALGLNVVKGYDIDGENLDKLFGAG